MSHCYQLIPLDSNEPATLQSVDEAICKHLNIPVDPDKWVRNWHNVIGLGLALGYNFPELREKTEGLEDIIDFLETHYIALAFRS